MRHAGSWQLERLPRERLPQTLLPFAVLRSWAALRMCHHALFHRQHFTTTTDQTLHSNY